MKKIKEKMFEWGEFSVQPKKTYIVFKGKTNIADFQFHKSYLGIWLNLKRGMLNDESNLCKDVSTIGQNGNGDYKLEIKDDENIDYVLSLIKQSWNVNK